MNIGNNLRKLGELSIGIGAIVTLALAGCGGGGSSGSSGGNNTPAPSLTGLVSTIAGLAGTPGLPNSSAATGTSVRFEYPANIATDGTNLFVTDEYNNTIRKIVIASGAVTIFAGSTTAASGVSDGQGTGALFNTPRGIVYDGTGSLYVADMGNNSIRKIDIASQQVSTPFGSLTGASGVSNGTSNNALFYGPFGVTKLGSNLYVTDAGNSTIRKIDLTNSIVNTFAGTTGGPGYSTGAAGTSAMFNAPADITTDGTNLFVADSGNHNIRQINVSTQMVSTLAGSSWISTTASSAGLYPAGTANGTGTFARFNLPAGLTSDGTNLFVSDSLNHTIRKVVIGSGLVTTLAGSNIHGTSDGTGAYASFYQPVGILYLNSTLYVADWRNHTIRKIQ